MKDAVLARSSSTGFQKDMIQRTRSSHQLGHLNFKHIISQAMSTQVMEATQHQIENLKKGKLEKNRKVDDANKTVASLNDEITSIQNSIEKVKSSDDYKKYLDLKNSLEGFKAQKSKIKNEIDTQFTKISRPLSRYEYGSSLDKDQKNILSKLVENPFDVLLPQHKDSIIVILENVRKGISSGSISVKDIDKSMSQITETEETLDGFVKQISEYLEKYEKMNSDLNSLNPKEMISLEHELDKNTSSMEDLQLKSETLQGEIDEIDSKIPQIISEIESKLRRFSNTKYTLLSS